MPLPRLSERGSGSTVAIGAMNRQITIQQRTATNSDGQQTGAYSNLITVWAKIEHLSGKEVVNGIEFSAEITTRFTTPYTPGIEPRMRVKYVDLAGKTHYYDLLYVQNVDERGFFLELLAQEIFSAT